LKNKQTNIASRDFAACLDNNPSDFVALCNWGLAVSYRCFVIGDNK